MPMNRLFQSPYLPVTYRRDPLSLVSGGATVGLGRSGLESVQTQAPAGVAGWEPPGWFRNLPLGGFPAALAQGVESVATWPYRNMGQGVAPVGAPVTQAPGMGPRGVGLDVQPQGFRGRDVGNVAAYDYGLYLGGPRGAGGAGTTGATSIADQLRAFGGGGGAGEVEGGPQFREPIDPEIDRNWYIAFQREHDGQTPEEFYTGLPYDQLKYNEYRADLGLEEALDDLKWSRGFQQMTGKKPTDDDWKAWWMHNYGRDMRTSAERERDKTARKGGPGRKLPRFRGQGQEPEQRPPLWVPPVTYWR